jgi:hypothetical protein
MNHIKWIAPIAIFTIIIAWALSSYYGAYNYGADAETTIETEYSNMENILGQYSLKVKEAAQIPSMKTEDLKEVMDAAFTGRYGENGSQATFQWIQENYPGEVTDALYTQIQQVMEAGRNKFENAQTKFLDTKRPYIATLKKDLFLSDGWWLAMADYPKIDLDDFVIISSEHASESFKTKIDKGLILN